MLKQVIFESERLLFFRPEKDDFDFLRSCQTDSRMMEHQGGLMDETQMNKFLNRLKEHWLKHGFGHYIAILKDKKILVGYFSLKYLTDAHAELKEPDLGYAIIPKFWGMGLATEGGKALVKYAFDKLHFSKIQALNYPENKASTRVLEKIGFKKVGTVEVEYLGRNYGTSTKWELAAL